VDNWKKLTKSRNRVRKKCFGGTFCFSNCHIIGLDTGGLVFLVYGFNLAENTTQPKVNIPYINTKLQNLNLRARFVKNCKNPLPRKWLIAESSILKRDLFY
jgi:hypothetical protein